MQAIHNTTANTITLKPAAPVDAPTFARLKNAGFAWRADSGAFVASPAGDLARGVASDLAGHIETRDSMPAAWMEFNGATLGGFPRAELFLKNRPAGIATHAAFFFKANAADTCNAAGFDAPDNTPTLETEQASSEAKTEQASSEDAADDDGAPAELCDDIERATYSPEDNKIRLYPARRLPADIYARVKAAGFSWAPKQGVFVAPAWTPARADLAESLAGELGDEDTTLAERAEQRADRFEEYHGKRAADADQARRAVDAIAEHIPFGQPILVGHHSERRARKDAQRIEDGMRRAVKLWDTAEYWTRRAAGAIQHAKYKERPDVRARRIKTIEAAQRKNARGLAESQKWLQLWTRPGLTLEQARALANVCWLTVARVDGLNWTAYDVLRPDSERGTLCPAWTVDQVQAVAARVYPRSIAHAERWDAHYKNRLAYERAMLEEQGAAHLLEKTKRPAPPPLLNYRAPEGFTLPSRWHRGEFDQLAQVEMSKAEYMAIYADYRGTRTLDGHRIRTAYQNRQHVAVFLTDSKTHPRPQPAAADPETVQASSEAEKLTPAETVQASGEAAAVQASGEDDDGAPFESVALTLTADEVRALSATDYRALVDGLEDSNAHSHCAILDAKRYGTALDVREALAILEAHERAGSLSMELYTRRQALGERLQIARIDDAEPAQDSGESETAPQNIAAIPEPAPAPAADPGATFAAMRESLRAGVQVVSAPQLFPTPAGLAARMVELADIQPGARVLEPSAGKGRILQAIREAWTVGQPGRPIRTAVEIDARLCDRLEVSEAGADILRGDFLTMQAAELGTFDRVLMNPPFVNGADIKHIQHAAGLLKPGGRLVAICANGPRQRAQLMPITDYWEDLPAGTFAESGTDVRAALLVIEAPAATYYAADAEPGDWLALHYDAGSVPTAPQRFRRFEHARAYLRAIATDAAPELIDVIDATPAGQEFQRRGSDGRVYALTPGATEDDDKDDDSATPATVQASSEQKPGTPSSEHAARPARKPKSARAYDFPNAQLKIMEDGTCREFPKWCPMISVVRSRAWVADALRQLRAFNKAKRAPAAGQVQPSGEDPQATPSGEATAPLVAGRWIPHGAENAERIAVDAAIGAEVWLIASTRQPGLCAVIAYAGKRTKHDGHYTMRDRAQALQWAAEYLGKRQASAQRQAEQRAEKAAKRAAGHKLQVGDVLRSSWGYDQTNIDYYEVTRLVGKRMVEIRKIGAESAGDGYMTGDCVPRPGHYTGEPMRKMVSDYDGKSVRIASYASANKIEPRDVGGVKVWPVDHWTAYA